MAGFTLVEIVVATFIMAVFTVLVLGVSNGVLQIWGSAAGRVESTRESRLVLSTIESDFDGIVYTSSGEVLHYEIEDLGSGNFDPQSQARLILVASTLDAPARDFGGIERPGDICGIRYELNYLKIFDGSGTEAKFSLYRGTADTLTTFNELLGVNDLKTAWEDEIEAGVGVLTESSPAYKVSSDAGLYSSQNRRNIYASNVVDFKVTFYSRDLTDASIAEETVNTFLALRDGQLYVDDDTTPVDRELVYADLQFAFLSSEGALALQRHSEGVDSIYKNLTEIIDEYGQRFTRRVALSGAR